MTDSEVRVLIEAVAKAQDELTRRLLLNILLLEMERLRLATEGARTMRVVRGGSET